MAALGLLGSTVYRDHLVLDPSTVQYAYSFKFIQLKGFIIYILCISNTVYHCGWRLLSTILKRYHIINRGSFQSYFVLINSTIALGCGLWPFAVMTDV